MDSISVVKLNRDGPLRSRIAAAAGGANPSAPPLSGENPRKVSPPESSPAGGDEDEGQGQGQGEEEGFSNGEEIERIFDWYLSKSLL